MGHKHQKIFALVILPCLYTLIFAAVIGIGGKSMFQLLFGGMQTAWIANTPEYAYQSDAKQDKDRFPAAGEQYGELLCERIGFRVPLYYGDSEQILEKGAGTWIGGALPGKEGAALIGAHDSTFFKALEQIEEKDEIIVKTTYGSYTYHVKKIEIQNVVEFKISEAEKESDLVLYTCYPFGKTEQDRKERYFVYAEE